MSQINIKIGGVAYQVEEGMEIKISSPRALQARRASVEMGGMTVNIAVTSGMRNAKVLLDQIREGSSKYH